MSQSIPPAHHRSFGADFRRNFIAGLFVLLPVIVTIWLLNYLFNLLSQLGQPLVDSLIRSMTIAPGKTERIQKILEVFKDIFSFIFVVILIYLIGWFTNKLLGKRLLKSFDNVIDRIPLAKGIYGTVKQLLSTFQTKPDGVERVVLINFPTEQMKTVGLVMRTFKDIDSGRELAAVYVPTAPNPTSGYLELVPVEDVINTSWTVDEAMRFIVSGGAVGPEFINYDKSAERVENKIESPSPSDEKP